MENQHKKITGYRDLTQSEIDLMNDIKSLAIQTGELVAKLQEISLESECIDMRWVNIGATDLQKGFMALTRSVAQPTTF